MLRSCVYQLGPRLPVNGCSSVSSHDGRQGWKRGGKDKVATSFLGAKALSKSFVHLSKLPKKPK